MKSRTYLLLTGVFLMVIGTIMVFVAGTSIDFYVPTSYLDELLSKIPLWLVFLLGCICVHVFEEFTFSYWEKGTVASKVISTVLIYISFYLV